jgi:hypothetical protein
MTSDSFACGNVCVGLQMMWHPDLLMMLRVFLLALAIIFLLSGTAMLILTLPLRFPWSVHTDLAARYAVIYLSIAAACAWGVESRGKSQR